MCGISGIVGRGWDRTQLEAMVAVQHHRGPDDSGVYVSETGAAGLGNNRLSIIDLSSAGHQPMANHDGAVWIAYNGEVYNYRELRSELSEYPFRSHTDTEVILAAYERWGDRCVEHFIGMFAFALWDERHQRLFCARDRLGIKPFHYAWHNGCFLFASEIKAILQAGYPARPDWSAWAAYLVHGYSDHGSETFFAGVSTLPPGHTLTLEAGCTTFRRYWDLPELAKEPLELRDEEAASRLTDLLDDAVRLRLRSDVPVGVNLSGGLDSASLIVTVDRLRENAGQIHTFTASFADSRYDELEFAQDLSSNARCVQNIQRLDASEVWELIKGALWHQEAPFGGISTLAYHHLHRLAQELGVPVLLEGQGVDEMLAGYAYFRPSHYLDLLERGRWRELRREVKATDGNGPLGLAAVRRLRSGAPLELYQDGTSHLRPSNVSTDVVDLAGEMPAFPRPFGDHLTNALYQDLCYAKLPRVLRMNDRLSMAFSRELREPYLDHRVVEFLFRLPGDQKIREGQSKFLLRHAMAGRLPEGVRLAAKRDVVTPQREWLRGSLRAEVLDLIHSRSFAERGLFDVNEVKASYRRFCDGEGENAFFVWQWLNAEMWFRMFIDGTGEAPPQPIRPARYAAGTGR